MSIRPIRYIRSIISIWYRALDSSVVKMMLLIAFIFIIETLVMLLLHYAVNIDSYMLTVFLDAFFLVVFLLPIIYALVLRPLSKQVEESILAGSAMKESLELLNGVFSSINEAVFIVSSETREIMNMNQSAVTMFGYTREEMLGRKTSMLHVDNNMYLKFGEMMEESYSKCGFFETKFRMRRQDGSTFPSEHSVRPINIGTGLGQSHVCVVRDISEQIWREEEMFSLAQELVIRNKFVESVLRNLKSGIIVVDHDYRIKLLNEYVSEECGQSQEFFVDKKLSEICPELYDAITAGVLSGEITVTLFNGKKIIGFCCFELSGVYNISSGYIINFKDLTEIIKIRKELRHKERLSAMGEVVASVAHEMRNPLFAISSVAQILEMELSLKPAQKQLLDSLLKESRRINDLVEELLDSTRELRLQRAAVELNAIVTETFLVLKTTSDDKKVTLRNSSFAEQIMIHADPHKLEQVLINLVKNAIEASSGDSLVDLTIEEGVGEVIVSVTDRGEGIAPDVFEKIFDVFFTTKRGGTGLGLSICRNIIEAHDGTLTAANNPGNGATFTVRLPFAGDNA